VSQSTFNPVRIGLTCELCEPNSVQHVLSSLNLIIVIFTEELGKRKTSLRWKKLILKRQSVDLFLYISITTIITKIFDQIITCNFSFLCSVTISNVEILFYFLKVYIKELDDGEKHLICSPITFITFLIRSKN